MLSKGVNPVPLIRASFLKKADFIWRSSGWPICWPKFTFSTTMYIMEISFQNKILMTASYWSVCMPRKFYWQTDKWVDGNRELPLNCTMQSNLRKKQRLFSTICNWQNCVAYAPVLFCKLFVWHCTSVLFVRLNNKYKYSSTVFICSYKVMSFSIARNANFFLFFMRNPLTNSVIHVMMLGFSSVLFIAFN